MRGRACAAPPWPACGARRRAARGAERRAPPSRAAACARRRRWTINFYDAFITSVYPILDLPFMYALYWGWYKGKAWDWDMHRQFGLSSYALQTIFAIVYFMTCDKGIFFSSTVPVVWRVFFNFLVIGPWAVYYYVPFLLKLSKLGKDVRATARRDRATRPRRARAHPRPAVRELSQRGLCAPRARPQAPDAERKPEEWWDVPEGAVSTAKK